VRWNCREVSPTGWQTWNKATQVNCEASQAFGNITSASQPPPPNLPIRGPMPVAAPIGLS